VDQPAIALAPNKRPIYLASLLSPVSSKLGTYYPGSIKGKLSTRSGLSVVVACQNIAFFVTSKT
jgi:hypothetical protein